MHCRRAMSSSYSRWKVVRWLALAVVALAVSGLLALVLVLGHIPAIASLGSSITELAERSLVVHVNLATGVWFFAFIVGLSCLESRDRRGRAGVVLATAGTIALVGAGLARAPVVLSDYVPVIDHPVFFAGLAAFAAGVVVATLPGTGPASTGRGLPRDVQHGLRASAVAFAIAMLTIAAAYLCRDPDATPLATYQHVFWGGGHVLQFAAVAGMLAAWLLLFHQIVGESAVSSRLAAMLFAVLLAPTALAPWLVRTGQSPRAFTWMMELGIFPVVLAFVIAGVASARRHGRLAEDHWPVQRVAMVGLSVSIAMTLLGFALGAAITGDTTLTPAHYHVSIGAVTVSFMTTLIVILPKLGAPIRRPRLAIWQPLLYGGGQTVFALGLAIAGFWGSAARKAYGGSAVSATAERIGWIIAAVGGLLAFAGGVAFVSIIVSSARRGARRLLPRVVRDAVMSR